MVKGFGFLIKTYDGFHDLWVVVPVLVLQEVTRKFVNFSLTCCLCEANDGFDFAGFDQALDTLHFFVGHGVDFGTEFEVTLLLHDFGYPEQNLNSMSLLLGISSSWWTKF